MERPAHETVHHSLRMAGQAWLFDPVMNNARRDSSRALLVTLFFLSGVAALVYQLVWQRMLVPFAGGDVASISLIVAVFLLGLGIGGIAGGVLADRGTRRQNLAGFALVEGAVAVAGVFSKFIIHDFLYPRVAATTGGVLAAAALPLMVLLVPTILMGMSLPLLARALIRDIEDAAPTVGRLYGINTLGAACGALVTTWMLMPLGGVKAALWVAAALNALAGVAATLAIVLVPAPEPGAETTPPGPMPRVSAAHHWPFSPCLAVFVLSGFLAIALEIVWFRLLGVILKPTAFTLGTLLGLFLTSLGAGALVGSRFAGVSRAPGGAFLWMQCCAALYACVFAVCALAAIEGWDSLRPIRDYLGGYEPVAADVATQAAINWIAGKSGVTEPWMAAIFFSLHLVLPMLAIGPPAFLMGAGFPFLQRAAHTHLHLAGRRTGWLQAANITGCAAGSLTASFAVLPASGTSGALRLIVLAGAVFGVLGVLASGSLLSRRSARAGLSILVLAAPVLALWCIPDQRTLWARAHGSDPASVIVAEDGAGVSVLRKPAAGDREGRTDVFVNGIGQSWLPYQGVHSLLGALPVLLHPHPERIAIIGLGSGDTLYCASFRGETKHIACVEIIGAQAATLRQLSRESPYPALRMLFEDERVRFVTGDGRRFLMSAVEKFDIIEADALRPSSAYSGFLFSEEYFRLVAARLKPGGFAVTWKATRRVRDTFLRVFPHALDLGPILIGSDQPINTDPSPVALQLADFEVIYHYRAAGLEILPLLGPLVRGGFSQFVCEPVADRDTSTGINTDLDPRDEFSLPVLWGR